MGKYESPRNELWSFLGKIREQSAQDGNSSSYNDGLAKEISETGYLSKRQESQAAHDFNQRLAQKRQGRNS